MQTESRAGAGVRIQPEALARLCGDVLQAMGVSPEEAAIVADVLVTADLRGTSSHGTARLGLYVSELRAGYTRMKPAVRIVRETPVTALLDGDGGLGPPVASRAMRTALDKAEEVGAGLVSVRNSNHFGIAAYYAMMALERDMIGIAMTNASVLATPTFGRDAMLGTNPISVAAPAGNAYPYVLDMATSTVSYGKVEVYGREGRALPMGWALDETGAGTTDATRVMDNLERRKGAGGGGLLPLGGIGELLGGHKGYGLALMVDILSGVLPGAGYADRMYLTDDEGGGLPANVGHFFGAIRIDAFRPVEEFKATMDDLIRRLKATPKLAGEERIYIHGEKEFEAAAERQRSGVTLHPDTVASLRAYADEFGVPFSH
jgi:LDH2 family malate/lactate/ureidoglycolate dehydrogenase